jgi:enoyl-CoA hydratase/carnithine racemase
VPAPVIAAVEGGAYGMGWGIALACDMVIASEQAKFCAPFLSLGLIPDGGFVWFLRRQLGVYKAAEIIFSERIVLADEAAALGLLSKIVPAGSTVDTALEFATVIGKGNRHSVELTKRLLQTAETSELAQHSALELALGAMCQSSDEVARVRAALAAAKK